MELFYSLIWMNIRFISITLWFYHLFSWACIQNFKFINLLHNKYPKLIEYSKTFYNAIEWFINFLFEKLDFNKGIHPLLFTGIITFLMVLLKWHYNKKTEMSPEAYLFYLNYKNSDVYKLGQEKIKESKIKKTSKTKKDWLTGEEYIQHYEDGKEVGKSKNKKSLWGSEYVQHYDKNGKESGRSVEKEPLFGENYTQHYDSEKKESGRSKLKNPIFGNEYVQNYNADKEKISKSKLESNWLTGEKYTQHHIDKDYLNKKYDDKLRDLNDNIDYSDDEHDDFYDEYDDDYNQK
ncbi:hypothetical protein [Empedobacter sp. GD03797]|uniref:hypothetical protein n=1 Tax=Empedobacter sp. GD03797 TaxID=2975382 RepID=UPI00244B4C53|nr:hypothetical protein [Empedobacter sp. GD03797]MDH1884157.1 hypothetical protein [Empedobacter sp. GD03797]